MAGATATAVTYPFDLLRARMAAHWGPTSLYPGPSHPIPFNLSNSTNYQ
jgi:hypothetical protein